MRRVAKDVVVLTSRVMSTTTTIVAHEGMALVVDPCWEPDELACIARLLRTDGLAVALGWSTHAHHDHVLWHPELGAAPRLATPAAAAAAAEHRGELRTALGPRWPAELLELVGTVSAHEATRLPWPGTAVEVVSHDAHAPGHGALWLPQRAVLVAGDMLSDVEIPLLDRHSGADTYRRGLETLAPFVEQAEVLVCGHGTPAVAGTRDSPTSRLAADRTYLSALAGGGGGDDSRLRTGPDWLRAEHVANLAAS